ncbi:response regulator [Luteibacter sp. Lutesp34]|uniref:response regulator n=1 Tax=Luteibacter sp. Lutesp34 TaxID=3243030 RepID=UPI0039B522CF
MRQVALLCMGHRLCASSTPARGEEARCTRLRGEAMRFLVADVHPIVLVALSDMLRAAFPGFITRVDTAAGAAGLLRRIKEVPYDYLVVEPEMSGFPQGIPLLKAVREAGFLAKLMVYTGNTSPCAALAALELGALAYVSKCSGPQLAIDAARAMVAGETFVDPSIDLEAARNHPWNRLSQSERGVMLALAKGENMQALAIDSHRSYKTVMTHKYNAFRKLGLRSKAEVGAFLNRHGLSSLVED